FTIIGLFAFRLAKKLMEALYPYVGRDEDLVRIAEFLANYHESFSLAKISGSRLDNYVHTYPAIVSWFRKRDNYPDRYMDFSPDYNVIARPPTNIILSACRRGPIMEFADAACGWGSTVLIPAHQANHIILMMEGRFCTE
ncbi:hypothetical protein BS50DRAFT_488375, partial [Corynespora cassiicola Philippines]